MKPETDLERRLADCLMEMANQHFLRRPDREPGGGFSLEHGFLSANEHTEDLLVELGLAEETGSGIRLLWDQLKQ